MFVNPLTNKIADFLTEIGLKIVPTALGGETFLNGILIKNGALLVDEEKLQFPGDLLHEAGHLAVAPANIRHILSDEVDLPDFNMGSIEAAAMLWSYAAALYLEIDPRIVFHDGGYHGNSEALLFGFSVGFFPGVNVLEDAKMTATGERAAELKVEPFPKIIKWLRE